MRKWEITLINVGRAEICKEITTEATTREAAKLAAIQECPRHLMSRDIDLSHATTHTYLVVAGIRIVGEVRIEPAKMQKGART